MPGPNDPTDSDYVGPNASRSRRYTQPSPGPASKAPSHKHFEMLESCMQEAMDDNDDFARRQAISLLTSMLDLIKNPITPRRVTCEEDQK